MVVAVACCAAGSLESVVWRWSEGAVKGIRRARGVRKTFTTHGAQRGKHSTNSRNTRKQVRKKVKRARWSGEGAEDSGQQWPVWQQGHHKGKVHPYKRDTTSKCYLVVHRMGRMSLAAHLPRVRAHAVPAQPTHWTLCLFRAVLPFE